jgi:8-oxo-dGTP diphosphatase
MGSADSHRVERGGRRLTAEEIPGLAIALETSMAVILDPGPDEDFIELLSGQEIVAETIRESLKFRNDRSIRWDDDDNPQFLATPASIARQQGQPAGSPQDDQGRRLIPNQPRTAPASTVVAAIVTSPLGVLVGQRRDGKPPWTFIAGEVEPGELPEDAAVREVKEETGLEVRSGQVIGERNHPATGRYMIYMAAEPVRGTSVFVGDEAELAEVRWVSLAEVDELLPGMFKPVREHLVAVLSGESGS